jgi:PAS domain S-box-containing protein
MDLQCDQEFLPPSVSQEAHLAGRSAGVRAETSQAALADQAARQFFREDRLCALVTATGQILWITNAEGLAAEDVPTWRAYTGQSLQQIQGWGWLEAVHPEDRERTAHIWSQAVASRSLYEHHYRLRRHDGVYRTFLARGVPLLEADGSVREWVGCCTDITNYQQLVEERARQLAREREQLAASTASLQERLRESNAQLVAASLQAQQRAESLEEEKEGRETFISLVAHELRSPLTVLSGYIQLLERGTSGGEKQNEEALRKMREQASRLKRLIDDLLDVSRIASGHFAIKPVPTDLAALARKAVEEAQSTTTRHAIRLELPAEAIIGAWDRQRITQVFSNLLSNAIKYSAKGGEIHVIMQLEAEGVRVAVRDQGIGLTPPEIDRLFQPYTQLARTRQAAGNGLGLYITRGIIEAHGGRIWAASPGPDQGSMFTFILPYQTKSD